MEYGCIAEHLSHSFSKEIHARLADYRYELHELQPCEVGTFLQQRDFRGINVTIPYKQTVIPFLDEITPIAKSIGAVNTIVNRDGRLRGDNTDFWGMKYLLERENINPQSKNVLIFGTGGTSRTAQAVVRSMGAARVGVVSRREGEGVLTYAQAKASFPDAQIIINTTPSGMFPHEEALPYDVDLDCFPQLGGVLDAIYHPLRSELVLAARARGINATGGLTMLVVQAAVAVERFLDTTLPPERVAEVDREIRMSKENIVLIGMPGCGKSSVGARLAQKYNRKLIDTDQELINMTQKTPADIIETQGEAAFRELEAEAVKRAATESGVIIATGGGAILRDDNVRRLRRNGRLIFLNRPPEQLPVTDDRPLSRDRERLMLRYAERIDRYRVVADVILPVTGDEDATADAVAAAFEGLI
ncbi:MAG: AAA family ATPase [Clostridia bacterium]|nr:AAA family ATPase [Clostridia bacterium]